MPESLTPMNTPVVSRVLRSRLRRVLFLPRWIAELAMLAAGSALAHSTSAPYAEVQRLEGVHVKGARTPTESELSADQASLPA